MFVFIHKFFHLKKKKSSGTKFTCKNKLFQSSGTKTEFHAKFRDETNSLIKKLFIYNKIE